MEAGRPLSHGHARADRRNLHLHARAIENLRRRPELRARVLELLERWLAGESTASSRAWLDEWRVLLRDEDVDRLAAVVLDPERGQSLRQCSPLGPALTPGERWEALREVNEALRRERRDGGS